MAILKVPNVLVLLDSTMKLGERFRRLWGLGFLGAGCLLDSHARADLKSWSVSPELVTVGSLADRVLWNFRPGLGLGWHSGVLERDELSTVLDVRVRYDKQARFASTRKNHEFHLNKAYLQWQGNRASCTVGYQKYTWGDSAFFDGVDMLNPRDLSEPLYADDDQSKRPIPSLNLQYLGDNTIFQAVFNAKVIRSPLEETFENIEIRAEPERGWFESPEWGFKAGGLLKNGWDINGYLLSHSERLPQFVLVAPAINPTGAVPTASPAAALPQPYLRLNEPRVFSLGLTATQAVGDFVFRSEFALHANRALPDQGALIASTSDQVVVHSTLDVSTFRDLVTTFEFWAEHWFANATERFKPNSILMGARMQKPLWDGKFEPSGGYLFSPKARESWLFARLQLKPMGSLQISLESHWTETSTGRVLARRGLKDLVRSSVSYQF